MADVQDAVAAIREGQPVILPTDTVYGLCATPYLEEAAARVYRLKGRPEGMPTALLCSDVDLLFECVPELRGRVREQTRALLPGPYTLVLPNPGRRFRWLAGDRLATIGVRVPTAEDAFADVLREVGALMATSANRHHGLDPRRLEDVPREIRDGCAAEIDGGELPGVPSTVIDLTGTEPKILREGAVPAAEVLERLTAPAA
ncbi:MAG TPA: L-threonylcarbamoyladenylate synthase [Gaiellaceae bacterium]|nr:L-threonylcarbamoyladenylate synthase [Gaiellaceae bacterium]